MSRQNRKTQSGKLYLDAAPRIERWLLCQQIGVVFYESEIPFERLKEIKDYFRGSDALKEEIFEPRLK